MFLFTIDTTSEQDSIRESWGESLILVGDKLGNKCSLAMVYYLFRV